MQVAVVTGPGEVELRSEPRPEPGPEDVLVEVGVCGLCTMERRLFSGEKQIYPVAPGHEAAGRVIEVGDAVAGLPGTPRVGELVTMDLLTRCGTCHMCRRGRSALCRRPQGGALSDGTISMGAGLADLVVVSARQAYTVGEIPVEHASMGEPLACVVHSVRLSGFRPGDRVAVAGAGYMGRLHLALCRSRGGRTGWAYRAPTSITWFSTAMRPSSGAAATRSPRCSRCRTFRPTSATIRSSCRCRRSACSTWSRGRSRSGRRSEDRRQQDDPGPAWMGVGRGREGPSFAVTARPQRREH